MNSLITFEDCELVRMPDYIPEEYRDTYDLMEKHIEHRINSIISIAKKELVGRNNEDELMQALSNALHSDRQLNHLKKSFAEFQIICCRPRFLLKKKGEL